MKMHRLVPLALAAIATSAVSGQEAHSPQAEKAPAMDMAACNKMMAERQKVQASSTAQATRLRHLVSMMKNATAHNKTNAIESVVNELAQQQLSMTHTVNNFHNQVVTHMVAHTQNHTLDLCPMMKKMSADAKKPAPKKTK